MLPCEAAHPGSRFRRRATPTTRDLLSSGGPDSTRQSTDLPPLDTKTGKGRRLHALDSGTLKDRWTLKLAYDGVDVSGGGSNLVVAELRNVNGVDQGQVSIEGLSIQWAQ